MKKLLSIIAAGIFLILLVGLASAEINIVKQGNCASLETTLNATAVNISSITYPNQTIVFINQPMTSNAYTFNYTFCDTNLTGQYFYKYYDNNINTYVNSFQSTYGGYAYATGGFLIFIWILFILAVVGTSVMLIMILFKLATASETIVGVMLAWGFFILLIATNYLSLNFMQDNFISSLTGTFIQVSVWSNGVLPVISLIITMFIKGTQKKKPLSPQELTGGFGFR